VSARSSGGAEANMRLDAKVVEDLTKFTQGIERAARSGQWLDGALTNLSRKLHEAILGGDIGKLMPEFLPDEGSPPLVRLGLDDTINDAGFSLHDVPWEALCTPNTMANPSCSTRRGRTCRLRWNSAPGALE
jgi:hypothetical protein